MKRNRSLTVAALVALAGWSGLSASSSYGQQPATDRVAAVLEKVPAENAEQAAKLRAALAELNPGEIARLCTLVAAPGSGPDDTKPRMALHALAWHAGNPGQERVRRRFIEAGGFVLQGDVAPAVKAFVLQQLQIAGGPDAVPLLAKFLDDERLYEPATQALLAIGGEPAAAALRKALPTATGARRVAIIDALGLLRDAQAGPLVEPDTQSADPRIRWAALWAEANLAEAGRLGAAGPALESSSWYERNEACALLLRVARRLVQAGKQAAAAEQLQPFLWHRFPTGDSSAETDWGSHVQCAALYGWAELEGPKAVGRVVDALTSENVELRAAAANIAVAFSGKGVTEAFTKMLKAPAPATRAAVLRVLERRGDAAALPAAQECLKDAEKDVRLAAVTAVAALGKEQAIEALVQFLNTDQQDEQRAAQAALVRMPGPATSVRIAAAVSNAPSPVAAALLAVLADRRAVEQLETVYAATKSADETVRTAAITAVGVLADEHAVAKLLPLLSGVAAPAERQALEVALAATANRAADVAQRAAPILAAIRVEQPADYASLLRALGRIGGDDALAAVQRALADPREEIHEAAYRALTDWPDAGAAEIVLAIAKGATDLKYHVLALRAYIRLVGLDSRRPPDKLLAMYQAGMQVTRRPEEQKLLLAKLGEVRDERVLSMLEPYLTDAVLAGEAAAALVNVADGLLPAGWRPARTALEKALAASPGGAVQRRAEQVLERVAECEGFITDWLVAGPYLAADKRGDAVLDLAFPPEDPTAKDVVWKPQPVTADPADFWYMNLNTSVGGPHRAAYLRTWLYSPQAQDILLELGSDDGIKVWLNGEVVHTNNVLRGCDKAQDKVRVKLRAGWNELLLKVVNLDGGWAACARVRAADGGRPAGVYAQAERGPS